MLELPKYELTSTFQFLTTECKDGIKLKKPDKASLTRELVSQLPQETRNVKSDAQMKIVDFMALVRKLPMKMMGLHTFGELAESLSNSILATGSASTRIDIIFMFIKNHQSSKWNGHREVLQNKSLSPLSLTIRNSLLILICSRAQCLTKFVCRSMSSSGCCRMSNRTRRSSLEEYMGVNTGNC